MTVAAIVLSEEDNAGVVTADVLPGGEIRAGKGRIALGLSRLPV